ncbi:hypothetical protein ACM1ZW_20220 [Pseudomonas sp. NFX71]|jgi:hypothetical protein|uniref:hypothetical protein n=1 Tax=Pseudomonas sp. NFX71 TaxID=3399121 RepID=UPI003A8A6230
MNPCKSLFSPDQEAKLRVYDRWHRAIEVCSMRMDCPDAYHDELLRQADEMDRLGIVTWQECVSSRRFWPFFALSLAPILFDIYLLSQLFRMSDSLAKNPVSGRLGRFSSPAPRR